MKNKAWTSKFTHAKTVGQALKAVIAGAPDINVAGGEISRVHYEKKPFLDALKTVAELELANYTGLNRFDGKWKWQPLRTDAYDWAKFGRSPIKIGPVYNYGIKILGPKAVDLVQKVPLIGPYVRKILSTRSPLKSR